MNLYNEIKKCLEYFKTINLYINEKQVVPVKDVDKILSEILTKYQNSELNILNELIENSETLYKHIIFGTDNFQLGIRVKEIILALKDLKGGY